DPVLAGSDPAPVRLPRAAEFSAALQRGADAAGADRSPRGGAAAIRAGALGPDPALGQGPADVRLAHQCARGIGERPSGVPPRHAMRGRRCLVPADGFYAWKDEGGRKRPYCVRPRQGGPIAFAGLWETWMGPNGEEMETAIIITTAARGELARLHERMPVIVP